MKTPLNINDIRKFNQLATIYSKKTNRLATFLKMTCPLVMILLAFITYTLLDKNVLNGFDTTMNIMFYSSVVIALVATGVVINLSIYAIYAEITRPFNFTYKRAFRNGEEMVSMDIYEGMFSDEKSFDLGIINATELTKNFYETITKVQNRSITVFEYDIIKHLHEKITQ